MEEEIKKLKREVNQLQRQVELLLDHCGLSDSKQAVKVERVKTTDFANCPLGQEKEFRRLQREAKERALAESMKP